MTQARFRVSPTNRPANVAICSSGTLRLNARVDAGAVFLSHGIINIRGFTSVDALIDARSLNACASTLDDFAFEFHRRFEQVGRRPEARCCVTNDVHRYVVCSVEKLTEAYTSSNDRLDACHSVLLVRATPLGVYKCAHSGALIYAQVSDIT
jgi:hypothetical protein